MRKIVMMVAVAFAVASVGCAKAPVIKRTAPNFFMGLKDLPDNEGRLLVYRSSIFFGDGAELKFDVGNCKFSLGVRQFAVCPVPPGQVTVEAINVITTIDVPNGSWVCSILKPTSREFFPPTDCRKIFPLLKEDAQVWTSLVPKSEIRPPKLPTTMKRNRYGKRRRRGK